MDEYPTPIMPSPAPAKRNAKIISAVVVLMIVGGAIGAYFYYANKSAPAPAYFFLSSETAQGTVTGVDTNASLPKITINTIATAATTSVERVLMITPSVQILKTIIQKSASGVVEKQITVEVNVADVQKGDVITATYLTAKGSPYSSASAIALTVEGSVDAYNAGLKASPVTYVKGQLVLFNPVAKTLQYRPFVANAFTATTTVSFATSTPLYKVPTGDRVPILHARTPATIIDMRPNSAIYLMVDTAVLQAGKIVPQALFVISGT